jgi:hypothetical protein
VTDIALAVVYLPSQRLKRKFVRKVSVYIMQYLGDNSQAVGYRIIAVHAGKEIAVSIGHQKMYYALRQYVLPALLAGGPVLVHKIFIFSESFFRDGMDRRTAVLLEKVQQVGIGRAVRYKKLRIHMCDKALVAVVPVRYHHMGRKHAHKDDVPAADRVLPAVYHKSALAA